MNKQVLTFPEIEADIQNSAYKRVALFDVNGQKLVTFNSTSVPLVTRLSEVKKRLGSRATPDGIYQVHAKHWGKNAVANIYYVVKGDEDTALAGIEIDKPKEVTVIQKETANIPVNSVSFDEYRKVVEENNKLQYDIRSLNDTIDNLNTYVAELENEEPEQKGLLSDNTKEFLSTSIENVIPLIDRYMDQRDVQQKIELIKVTGGQIVQGAQPQRQQPATQMDDNGEGEELSEEEEMHLDGMELLKQQNPELYASTMNKLNAYYANQEQEAAQ